MKLALFALIFLTFGAHADEFRVKAWKKPPNWKCRRIDEGALTCRSPYSDETATMTMGLKKVSAGESLSSLRPSGEKVHFATNRDIHGVEWLDSLYQSGSGLVRSSQTLTMVNGKKMAFEVRFEAPKDTYEAIQKEVNRTISSVKLYRNR